MFRAYSATLLLYKKNKKVILLNCLESSSTYYDIYLSSVLLSIIFEPGFELIPPKSIISTPSFNILSTWDKALSMELKFPPS